METQESGTGRVRFITRAFPRAFPPQWKAGLRSYMRNSGYKTLNKKEKWLGSLECIHVYNTGFDLALSWPWVVCSSHWL